MDKLIKLSAYITDKIKAKSSVQSILDNTLKIVRYKDFLLQPLELWMFIPCGKDGIPLEEYKNSEEEKKADAIAQCRVITVDEIKWIVAKERVLFEGFEWDGEYATLKGQNLYIDEEFIEFGWCVDDIIDWELELTETAKRMIL